MNRFWNILMDKFAVATLEGCAAFMLLSLLFVGLTVFFIAATITTFK